MAINLAIKTLSAIDACIEADQGAAYRTALGQVMPHMGDAFRGADEGFRSHLGASQIGGNCARQIWYGFHWAKKSNFPGRIVRLFNRGHIEEARFIAMLVAIGVQVYQQDANGAQFRISDVGGHFGGSGDGVGIGIPDLDPSQPCLLEFKTHNDKSFKNLQENGVREAKPEHYVQMQVYMRKMNIVVALYAAVNKNDDSLHMEIVYLDSIIADQMLDRARQIILMKGAPKKLNESPGWWECRFCDYKAICHFGVEPDRNCRTCYYAKAEEDGTWKCGHPSRVYAMADAPLSKEEQLAGCSEYVKF